MRYAPQTDRRPEEVCEIVDFDEALLDSCSAEERAELLTEARILAQVFATQGAVEELEEMAETLSIGGKDDEMDRARARKLAAAIRRLAKDPWSDPA